MGMDAGVDELSKQSRPQRCIARSGILSTCALSRKPSILDWLLLPWCPAVMLRPVCMMLLHVGQPGSFAEQVQSHLLASPFHFLQGSADTWDGAAGACASLQLSCKLT